MFGEDNFHLFMDLSPSELDELDELQNIKKQIIYHILFFEKQIRYERKRKLLYKYI